ncbi:MAG: GldG family protein [Chthoniobacterales bacterium]|nr:GldG family protein [Chthoniobacterales bacterium]
MFILFFIQLFSVVGIYLVFNYLNYHYYWRWDFSRSQEFRLAMLTRQLLRSLQNRLDFIIYYSPTQSSVESLIARDIDSLMKELVFSGKPKVKVEYVDPIRNINRASELANLYDLDPNGSYLITIYEGRHKITPLADLADFDISQISQGRIPKVIAFRGEQIIASVLLSLQNPEEKKVYILQGHGEASVNENSQVRLFFDYIRKQNLKIEPLNLNVIEKIPNDCSVIAIIGPKYDITVNEFKLLKEFWQEGEGRFLVLLDPDAFYPEPRSSSYDNPGKSAQPNLQEFLSLAGIEPINNRVLRVVPLQFAYGILRDVIAEFVGDTEIVKRLKGVNAYLPSPVMSLKASTSLPHGLQVRPLLRAAEPYWGETEYYTDENRGVRYEDGMDEGYPVHIGFVSDRRVVTDDRLEIPSARMIVIGTYRFALDQFVSGRSASNANLDFLISCVNWLLDRHRLTGIVPKIPYEFKLVVTNQELSKIAIVVLVLMPLLAGIIGFLVWLKRRY